MRESDVQLLLSNTKTIKSLHQANIYNIDDIINPYGKLMTLADLRSIGVKGIGTILYKEAREELCDPPSYLRKVRAQVMEAAGHPYLYPRDNKEKYIIGNNGGIWLFTDGSAAYGRAGAGVYFGPSNKYNHSFRVSGRQTNNNAEAQAVEEALVRAPIREDITIWTDSTFVIKY